MPSDEGALKLTVHVNYPDIGEHTEYYRFPDLALVERVFSAYTLGRTAFEPLVRRLQFLPIVRDANWAGAFPISERKNLLRHICDHRAQDILGALSAVVPPGGYLSAEILSFCGGHECDEKGVRLLRAPSALVQIS
jgi:hypothetical protein